MEINFDILEQKGTLCILEDAQEKDNAIVIGKIMEVYPIMKKSQNQPNSIMVFHLRELLHREHQKRKNYRTILADEIAEQVSVLGLKKNDYLAFCNPFLCKDTTYDQTHDMHVIEVTMNFYKRCSTNDVFYRTNDSLNWVCLHDNELDILVSVKKAKRAADKDHRWMFDSEDNCDDVSNNEISKFPKFKSTNFHDVQPMCKIKRPGSPLGSSNSDYCLKNGNNLHMISPKKCKFSGFKGFERSPRTKMNRKLPEFFQDLDSEDVDSKQYNQNIKLFQKNPVCLRSAGTESSYVQQIISNIMLIKRSSRCFNCLNNTENDQNQSNVSKIVKRDYYLRSKVQPQPLKVIKKTKIIKRRPEYLSDSEATEPNDKKLSNLNVVLETKYANSALNSPSSNKIKVAQPSGSKCCGGDENVAKSNEETTVNSVIRNNNNKQQFKGFKSSFHKINNSPVIQTNSSGVYAYTKLNNLREDTHCNLYGVIKAVLKRRYHVNDNKYCSSVKVVDETNTTGLTVHIFFKLGSEPLLEDNHIIRLHRLRIEKYRNTLEGKIVIPDDVVTFHPTKIWQSPDCTTKQIITPDDERRIEALRNWMAFLRIDFYKLEALPANSLRFNLKCKVVISKYFEAANTIVLRVRDGTICKLPCFRLSMNCSAYEDAYNRSEYSSYSEEVDIIVSNPAENFKSLVRGDVIQLFIVDSTVRASFERFKTRYEVKLFMGGDWENLKIEHKSKENGKLLLQTDSQLLNAVCDDDNQQSALVNDIYDDDRQQSEFETQKQKKRRKLLFAERDDADFSNDDRFSPDKPRRLSDEEHVRTNTYDQLSPVLRSLPSKSDEFDENHSWRNSKKVNKTFKCLELYKMTANLPLKNRERNSEFGQSQSNKNSIGSSKELLDESDSLISSNIRWPPNKEANRVNSHIGKQTIKKKINIDDKNIKTPVKNNDTNKTDDDNNNANQRLGRTINLFNGLLENSGGKNHTEENQDFKAKQQFSVYSSADIYECDPVIFSRNNMELISSNIHQEKYLITSRKDEFINLCNNNNNNKKKNDNNNNNNCRRKNQIENAEKTISSAKSDFLCELNLRRVEDIINESGTARVDLQRCDIMLTDKNSSCKRYVKDKSTGRVVLKMVRATSSAKENSVKSHAEQKSSDRKISELKKLTRDLTTSDDNDDDSDDQEIMTEENSDSLNTKSDENRQREKRVNEEFDDNKTTTNSADDKYDNLDNKFRKMFSDVKNDATNILSDHCFLRQICTTTVNVERNNDDSIQQQQQQQQTAKQSSGVTKDGIEKQYFIEWPPKRTSRFYMRVFLISTNPVINESSTDEEVMCLINMYCSEGCQKFYPYVMDQFPKNPNNELRKPICPKCAGEGFQYPVRLTMICYLIVEDQNGSIASLLVLGDHAETFFGCSTDELVSTVEGKTRIRKTIRSHLSVNSCSQVPLIFQLIQCSKNDRYKYHVFDTKLSDCIEIRVNSSRADDT